MKDPMLIGRAILKNGGVVENEAGTAIISIDASGNVTITADLQASAGSIGTSELADSAVTAGKIGSSAVTTAKINDSAVTSTKVVDAAGLGGLYVQKYALAVYDFAVDGGVIGTITLAGTATLPDNAVVTGITHDVLTTCTSATDAATIALSVPTDGALTTALAISNGANLWDAGAHLPNTVLPKKLTAARNLQITVAVEAITAGKIVFCVQYYVSQ